MTGKYCYLVALKLRLLTEVSENKRNRVDPRHKKPELTLVNNKNSIQPLALKKLFFECIS
ncbi:MAG: hypothetical protein ACKPE3_25205 [Sphaerospermopsis kisseleviana]